jgi:mannose-6-phosphate isomerase-like protein (cupin superfamily)
MLSPNPDQPVNLTAAVELAGLLDGRGSTEVLTGGRLTFGIHGPDGLEAIPERSDADTLYVIISGYGVLRCSDGERIEFTAGDVMFVPAGAEHRFDEIGPKFRMWRIEIGQTPDTATEEDGSAPSLE